MVVVGGSWLFGVTGSRGCGRLAVKSIALSWAWFSGFVGLTESGGDVCSCCLVCQKTAPNTPKPTINPSGTHQRRLSFRWGDGEEDGAGHGVPAPGSGVDSCSAFLSASKMELNASAP